MQLASHGLRALARKGGPGLNPGHLPSNSSTRSIHLPSFLHATPNAKFINNSTVQRLFNQTRTALSRFVRHLTAPGIGTIPSSAHSLHTGFGNVARYQARASIQQGFSLPVRMALSRPLRPPYLPRGPTLPRSVMQVGLGTARNFTSGRPLFQHLVENVPVAGRAFYEADWEIKLRQEREMMLGKYRKEKKATSHNKSTMKSKENTPPVLTPVLQKEPEETSELEYFFRPPATPDVITYLLIPLAPTPTTRTPLSADPSPLDHFSLLPLQLLGDLHSDHTIHALRVSTLFSRLDASNVWSRGVHCSAYSHGSAVHDPENNRGLCTILKVEFVGWTKAEVRGVIGESGSGWCVLEEIRRSPQSVDEREEVESLLSGMSNEVEYEDTGTYHPDTTPPPEIDPTESFILPTLDFSSSFLDASLPPSITHSPRMSVADLSSFSSDSENMDAWVGSDSGSDVSSLSSEGFSIVDPPSANGYFNVGIGFSSAFANREMAVNGDGYEPRESLFY